MKFVAILKQEAEGCDYTIGCGVKTIKFDAETSAEATQFLKKYVKENNNHEETKLSNIMFYEVKASYEVDVNTWYAQFDKEAAEIKRQENESKELAELERLKKKYNK